MNNPCILTDQEEQGNLKVEGSFVLRLSLCSACTKVNRSPLTTNCCKQSSVGTFSSQLTTTCNLLTLRTPMNKTA